MSTVESWKVPGEYFFDGVRLLGTLLTPESVQHAKDFHFRQDDILVATYPKSGEYMVDYALKAWLMSMIQNTIAIVGHD